jgi:hypothetical protein
MCTLTNGLCIVIPPIDPVLGVADESFYWLAEITPGATFDGGSTGQCRYALEAAFVGGPPLNGDQSVFGRVRTRLDITIPGTYTVTHPFGTATYTIAAGDIGPGFEINDTSDVPGLLPLNFTGVLGAAVGPMLYWDSGIPVLDPAGVAGSNFYLGDALTEHTIFGSPTGNNFFRVERNGVKVFETNTFVVSGKVFTNAGAANSPPTLVADVTDLAINKSLAVLAGSSKDIDVLVNDTPVDVAINPTTLAPVASANSAVTTVRAVDKVKVRYTPKAGFAGTDTITYNVATFTGLTAAVPGSATILVEDLQVTTAEFLPKLMKWRIEGSSNSGGALTAANPNTIEIRLGSAVDVNGLPTGPVLGTAQVNATTGKWVFMGKSTVSPAAADRTRISVKSANSVARNGVPCNVR